MHFGGGICINITQGTNWLRGGGQDSSFGLRTLAFGGAHQIKILKLSIFKI